MTNTTPAGSTVITPGSALDTGDYVQVFGTWYVLGEQAGDTSYTRDYARIFYATDRHGAPRRVFLDSSNVKAYRWDR